ncbi:hypothetical protein J3D49_001573 [Pseudomonas kilonensis]|nr:hypothetical protein [Pseudomonas kilonensis]
MPALPGVMKSLPVGLLTADTQFPNVPIPNWGASLLAKAVYLRR